VRAVGSAIYRSQVGDGTVTPGAYIAEHEAILAAIREGDVDVAERLTREHILAAPVPGA
jgi:DNA-binding GntR family transcriptional regulator